MKLALAAFAVACLSFGADAATAAVRGGSNDAEPTTRELQLDVGPVDDITGEGLTPKLAPDGMGIDEQHYYKSYETGSCTCAKEAYLEVYKEAGAHLKMVPLYVSDPIDVENNVFPKIQREINRLLDFAVCFLHSIDCGCDDAPYGKLPVKIFGKFKVSTYQCCCDVNAIRDIIINGIKELSEWKTTWVDNGTDMVTMVDVALVHKRKEYHVLENIVQTVYKNVLEVGEIYVEHGESCLEAICADDSLFEPSLPTDSATNDEYGCGTGGFNECRLVCDGKGKTVCGRTNSGGQQDCDDDSDCTSTPTLGNTFKCIPSSNPSTGYEGRCIETLPNLDTPCP